MGHHRKSAWLVVRDESSCKSHLVYYMGPRMLVKMIQMKKLFGTTVRILFILALVVVLVVSLRQPSLSRAWDEDVRTLAGVEILSDEAVTLTRIRDWSYTIGSVSSKDYLDATFDPNDIVAIWMYEQQLSTSGLIAHTFLVFEFDESYERERYLGLSVETRREQGETYSVIRGALRAFEITHIWATEKDLVTRRVQYLDYPLTRYRLEIPAQFRSRIFLKFVKETQSLASVPRWYNTASNNCTSSLIQYVNESEPGAIPFHYSYVLTGKVDEYLEQLGYKARGSALHITRDYLESKELR